MWEVWFEGSKLAEFEKLHLCRQFIAGWGQSCEVRRTFEPRVKSNSPRVTETVT